MQNNKKHLNIINQNEKIVSNTTCFSEQNKLNIDCQRKNCQHWIEYPTGHNCVMITAQDGPHTLQTIAQIYNLTRMRICQIEKNTFEKINRLQQ